MASVDDENASAYFEIVTERFLHHLQYLVGFAIRRVAAAAVSFDEKIAARRDEHDVRSMSTETAMTNDVVSRQFRLDERQPEENASATLLLRLAQAERDEIDRIRSAEKVLVRGEVALVAGQIPDGEKAGVRHDDLLDVNAVRLTNVVGRRRRFPAKETSKEAALQRSDERRFADAGVTADEELDFGERHDADCELTDEKRLHVGRFDSEEKFGDFRVARHARDVVSRLTSLNKK